MRAGFLQFEPRRGDPLFNLRTIRRVLQHEKFDLMVIPELSNSGHIIESRTRARELAERVPDGQMVSGLIAAAAEHGAFIIAGIAERKGTHVYNSAILAGPEGVIHTHRKVHLTRHEIPVFDRGAGFQVVDIRGVKVGIGLSFDIWMPEACRKLALDGAEILAVPANFDGAWPVDAAALRALENVCYVISANRIGVEESRDAYAVFHGGSQIIDCDGQALFRAGKEECAAVAEIDPARARTKRNVLCGDLMRELELHYQTARASVGRG